VGLVASEGHRPTNRRVADVVSVHLRLPAKPAEKGVVYTKAWVVDLILDLIGYRPEADLAPLIAVEPAAGEGAFLLPMVRRLVASLRTHGRGLDDARRAILAYELDGEAADLARQLVVQELTASGYPQSDAARIARGWVVEGDYLLSASTAPRADFVAGNPPYIRYDDLPPAMFRTYQTVCPTMVGRCDIYVGFLEAAIRQLTPSGRVGFICADRWMRAAYGTELRKLVVASASVDAVIEMHDAPAFEDEVSAYPAVTIIRSGEQGTALVATAGTNAGPIVEGSLADAIVELAGKRREGLPGFRAANLAGWYAGDTPWPWAEPEALHLIQHLEARFQPLEDPATGTKVGIGVATGADKVFVTTDATCVEPDRLLPLAMARDTRSGQIEWSGHYLVDPWGSDDQLVELATFPRLAAYFAAHATDLKRRNIAGRCQSGWYRTIDRVTHSLLGRPKLYVPDMKLQAHPVLDRGETYPHHNLYFVVSDTWDLEVLGGLMLSKIAELFVASYCVKMRGGTLRFQAQYLRRIRVPAPSSIPEPVRERLRVAFRAYDREAATAAALDAYGLTQLPFAA
jgi:adenine-specific DNA-methyltransferase